MPRDPRIAVVGANGHTGRFVVDEIRRAGGTALPATRSGRFRPIRGHEESAAAIDVRDAASLHRALADADAVINAAGPFLDTAEPVARAAVRVGIPYLDVTAEQMAALQLFERLDAEATSRGVTVVPAMGFYGGLADLLVTALAPAEGAHVEIAIGLDSWHPTAGTRRTGARNSFERLVVGGGKLVPAPTWPARSWRFPAPFGEVPVVAVPFSEMVLIAQHLPVSSVASFMNQKPLEDLHGSGRPIPSDARGRSDQRFVVDARVVSAEGTRSGIARGQDIYAVTAPLVVRACLSVVAQTRPLAGVHAPAEVLSPREFLQELAPDILVELSA